MDGDRCKESQTDPGTDWQRKGRGERKRQRPRQEGKNIGDTGTGTPSTCVAPSVAWGSSSPDWTEAVRWACQRGLLQTLWALGLKLSPILEGGPPAGLSSLVCEVGVTISAFPSLEGVAFPITEPCLWSVYYAAQFSCSHSTWCCQEWPLPHPCPKGCCPGWGGESLLVYPGPGPLLLSEDDHCSWGL